MKSLKSVFILFSLILFAVGAAYAQPFQTTTAASIDINFTNPADLTDQCTGGSLLDDGTPARFIKVAEGVPGDPRVAIGDIPATEFGYYGRTFELNGDVDLGMPGNFYILTGLSHLNNTFGDTYRCEVMGPTVADSQLVWMSPNFTPTTGPNEFYWEGGMWTCEWRPAGCPTPLAVQGFLASDSTCGEVLLTWDAYVDTFTVDIVDSLLIYRESGLLAKVHVDSTSYSDTTGVNNNQYQYSIKARRICVSPPDTVFSPEAIEHGTRRAGPPTPQGVVATDDSCGVVRVTWTYTTNTGLDSFRIKRDGVQVGSAYRLGTPGTMTFRHVTSDGTPANYCVVGMNVICGEGTQACNQGTALLAPTTSPANVVATDGNCNSVTVTWDLLAGATGYHVYRCNDSGGSCSRLTATPLGPTIQQYVTSTGTAPTVYGYRVSAVNNCGEGPQSPYDTGYWRVAPAQVTGVTATMGLYCTHVRICWNDLDNELGYIIVRNGATLDTVGPGAGGTLCFNDSTGNAGTTYSYAVKAYNDCGNGTTSTSASGKRKAPPGQVTGVSATDSVHCWGVRITWNSLTADSFQIKRDAVRIGVATSGATTYNDSTAAEGVRYNYTVTAYNVCGAGTESTANPGSRKARPLQVTGLQASDTSCFAIHLVWNDVLHEDSFRVIRDDEFLAYTAANDTSYMDDAATAGDHDYRVVAANTCGTGDTSVVDTGTRLAGPAQVMDIAASEDSCDLIYVTWTDVADEDSFEVLRNGVSLGFVMEDIAEYTDTDVALVPWENYGYSVVAYNECGMGTPSDVDSGYAAAIPPQIPTMYATDNTCDSVFITWTSMLHVDSFWVYRNDVHIGTVPYVWQFYSDHSATPGERYNYYVTAWNHCGEGPAAPPDSGGSLIFPSVPQNLTATTELCDRIELEWDASTGEADWYIIYRAGTPIDTIPGTDTTYSDATTAAGQFDYTVSALSDECGETEESTLATGERLEEAGQVENVDATNQRCDSVIVTWDAATGDVDGYIIYVDDVYLDSLDAMTLEYGYVPAAPGVYPYTVRAYSEQCGDGALSDPDNGVLLAYPSQVTTLTATINRCDGVLLEWQESSGSVNGYIVRRDAVTLDTVFALLLTTSYFDSTAPDGDSDYDVIAYSENCDDAAPSDPATGTVLPDATAPTDVTATDDRCDSVIVAWTASTGTFDYYNVYRDGTLHASVLAPTTTYGEAPTSGDTIRYTITAVDTVCGESDSTAGADGLRQADAGVPQNFAADGDCDGVNLVWNTSTGAPEGYNIYRGPDAQNLDSIATVFPPDTTYQDISAERGVTYVYAVSAYTSGCGETATSNTDTGMRLPLLEAVTGLTASTDNCDGIQLDWDDLVGAEQYKIFRDDVLLDSVDGSARTNTYLDTNTVALAPHEYRLAAENICGVGAQSDSAIGSRYTVPDEVTNLAASDTSCVAVYLVWSPADRADQYIIYFSGTPFDTVDAADTSYVDTLVSPGFAYAYKVRGWNHCGLGPIGTAVQGYRIPGVNMVVALAATDTLCDRICITWEDLPNEWGYRIYRGGEFLVEVDSNVTDYCDTSLVVFVYYYQIAAFNECGEGEWSSLLEGIRWHTPTQVQNVEATFDSCTSITVTWDDVADEDFYVIFRDSVAFDTVGEDVATYRDEDVEPGDYFWYNILAVNYCGEAPLSSAIGGAVATVPDIVRDLAATMDHCTTVTVTWLDLNNEQNYHLLRDGELLITLAENTIEYADTPTVGTHTYAVYAENYCGVGDTSEWVTGERQGIPTETPILTAPDSACGQVTITWTAVTDITGYIVFRDGTAIDTVDSETLSYMDSSLPGTYLYKVAGLNECGPGPDSNEEPVLFVPTPGQVTNLIASVLDCDTVYLTWDNVDNESGYYVFRDAELTDSTDMDVTAYEDTPDEPGTYEYTVQSYNDCGLGLLSDAAQGVRRGPPAQVTGMAASDTSCTAIHVVWNDVEGDSGYYVYVDQFDNPDTTLPANATGYIDTVSLPGEHTYYVSAFNDCGEGPLSEMAAGERLTIPDPVENLTATDNRCDGILVEWDDVGTEAGYRVYIDDIPEPVLVDQDVTSYLDTLSGVGTHTYEVFAYNSCGSSAGVQATGERLGEPLPPTIVAGPPECMTIVIFPETGGGDVDSFFFYRDGPTRVGSVHASAESWSEMITGTHDYYATAYSVSCSLESAASNILSLTGHDLAFPPASITVTTPETCDSIRLSWPAGTGEIEGYIVQRDGTPVDTVDALAYTDLGVDDPFDHQYAVAGYNQYCDAGDFTEPATGRMLPLTEIHTDLEDTLQAYEDTIAVELTHCFGVEVDSFFVSYDGGAFFYVTHAAPPVAMLEFVVPEPPDAYTDNCRARIISYRSSRSDTLTSDPFVIYRDLAADDLAGAEIPKDFMLDQNYPNPFNPATTVRFGVPRAAEVRIEIYDVLGRLITTLVEGTFQPGWHKVVWDCASCPTGMYIMRMHTDEKVLLRKMLLMK